MTRLVLLSLAAALALAACDDHSMTRQSRYSTYGAAALFPDGTEAQVLPPGAVAQGDLDRLDKAAHPPTADAQLLVRGQERYNIYCTPCHGLSGEGDGMVVRRGFPGPPSYHSARLRAAPAQHFFDVITDGYGVMYSYAARIEPKDRWAIVAYIRALQESRAAKVADMPEIRSKLPMTASAGQFATRTIASRRLAFGVALLLLAAVLLVIPGWFVPIKPMLRGWFVAFAIFSSIAVGSMNWLLIHRLTGGEWGKAAAPVLRSAAAMIPLLVLALVPVLAGLPHIYPWAADPSSIPADVAYWYLNGLSFSVRSLIVLAGWSFLAVIVAAGTVSRLQAALGLTFFGLSVSLVAVDWYLSLEPHYVATAFAAMIAVQQLLAALAVTALIGAPAISGRVAGDLGRLLIATLLGVVYLEFMTFVIAWYGDLPDKAEWFLKRAAPGWVGVLVAALVFGAVLPFGMLLVQAVRPSRRGLRVASALILFGTTLHFAWLLVPAFDDQAGVIAAALAGSAAMAFVSFLAGPALARSLEARHAE